MELHFSWKEIFTSFMVLFAVIDILGTLPIIVSLRKKVGHIQSEKATIAAGILLISFLYLGNSILNLVGIDVNSFAVAGSIILFIIAAEMILGIELQRDQTPETASIVPIAFPLIAGAGSLTTTLSLKAEFYIENIIIAIVLNMIIVYIVLKNARKLEVILGPNILQVLKKIFGVILLAIAVKLFSTNVHQLFH